MNTMIDARLLKHLPKNEQISIKLKGNIVKGYNCNFDIPSDCKKWINTSESFTHTAFKNIVVDYDNRLCWIYKDLYNGGGIR